MDSLWFRTLSDLREKFREMQIADAPVLNSFTEIIGTEAKRKYREPPHSLPETRDQKSEMFVWGEPYPLGVENWTIPIPANRLDFRDKSGKRWAVASYPINRSLYFRCMLFGQIDSFKAVAEDAGKAIVGTPTEVASVFPPSIVALCHSGLFVKRFRFGVVENEPSEWMIVPGANFGSMPEDHGVLVDWVPRAAIELAGYRRWMILLHRLAWLRYSAPRLEACRYCWNDDGHAKAAFGLIHEKANKTDWVDEHIRKTGIDVTRWFSVIGENYPIDLCEASVRAIDIILEHAKSANPIMAAPEPNDFNGNIFPEAVHVNSSRLMTSKDGQKKVCKLFHSDHSESDGEWLSVPLPLEHLARIAKMDKRTFKSHYATTGLIQKTRQGWIIKLDTIGLSNAAKFRSAANAKSRA